MRTILLKNIFRLLVLVPLFGFFAHVYALICYGVDIPFSDDWRDIINGTAGSFSWEYLMEPACSTLYPVGRFFDSLSIHFLAGDNVVYQAITCFLVLGGLALLQIILLRHFAVSGSVFFYCLFFLVFMMQPATYWGRQSLGYHQVLPLLSVLAILVLLVSSSLKNKYLPMASACFFCAMFGGFSYISGAVSITVLGVWLFVLSCSGQNQKTKRYRSCGIGLLVAACIALPAQVWLALLQPAEDFPKSLPFEGDFWIYVLGKVARSIGFLNNQGIVAFSIALLVSAFFLYVLCVLGMQCIKGDCRKDANKGFDLFAIYSSLFLVILAYLMTVAYGRAALHPESVDSILEIFAFGQKRFHFFWLTILLPWVALFVGNAFMTSSFSLTAKTILLGTVIVLGGYLLLFNQNVFDHTGFMQRVADKKNRGISCIKTNEGKDNFLCKDLFYEEITKDALLYSRRLGLNYCKKNRLLLNRIHTL